MLGTRRRICAWSGVTRMEQGVTNGTDPWSWDRVGQELQQGNQLVSQSQSQSVSDETTVQVI